MFESVNNMIGLTVSIAAFLGIMAEVVIIQQKSVDCVKIMILKRRHRYMI